MLRLIAAMAATWFRWSPSALLFQHCAASQIKSSKQAHRISGVRAIQRAAAKRRNQRRARR